MSERKVQEVLMCINCDTREALDLIHKYASSHVCADAVCGDVGDRINNLHLESASSARSLIYSSASSGLARVTQTALEDN